MIGFNIAGYIIFALVTSITPGPNNIMLFAYGKQFGYVDSNKLMLGIASGFLVLLSIAGYGIAGIILQNPTIGFVLKIISSLWLFYLAIVLSNLNADLSTESVAKAGFYQGFLMQFINPKAWIMAISGASAFLPHNINIHISVLLFALIFVVVGFPCILCWVGFGDLISKILKTPNAHRILGVIIFILMLLSIIMIWI